MKILLTGATGFVGQELGKALVRKGHEMRILTRDARKAKKILQFPSEYFECDLNIDNIPQKSLQGVEAIIHLAGEPIAAKRWSSSQKKKILESRTLSTRKIVQAVSGDGGKSVKTVLFASAIGFYGDRQEEELDEGSKPGKGFLSEVCQEWERSGGQLPSSIRSIFVRIGIVLGNNGGMLEKVLPIFRSGVGGKLGTGTQWMSWIHIDDLVGIFVEALENEKISGIVNGVSPQPVTNNEFTHVLAQAVKKRALFPAPSFALKLALGEMSDLMLGSQKVQPRKIQESGYVFKYSHVDKALAQICGDDGGDVFVTHQWVPHKIENVFSFFSEAKNLQEITPPWLEFQVKGMSTDKIQKDTRLDYQLKIHEVPVKWTTLITSWDSPRSFQDVQLKGPYSKWHHTHTFEALGQGTLVTDCVHYKIPLGFLGQSVGGFFVKKDIEKIFEYRREKIGEKFKGV